jgi:Cu(I)/Ag(I) efflux system membrane fusion protein
MKTKISLGKRDYKIIGIALLAGLLFGWLLFHGSNNESAGLQTAGENAHEEQTIWTCSMHPQIRMDKPGKCPICGMDLIPLQEASGSDLAISPDEIQMTETAMKIADIQTMIARKTYPDKEVYLLGKVKPDERNIAELTARFGGRIEKLYVNFTGQNVSKGEKLATIYSPSLVTAQKELLEAMEYKQSNPDFYKAARNKLRLWDLSDEQIDNIEIKGEARSYFDVLSPIAGTVTRRNVALGDYIKEGSALFQVIDLTGVWVMFEAYENDLPWIKPGDKVNFTIQSLPGRYFSGDVSFIDPLIDPKTRIARVRVEVQNKRLLLKPEMFANGVLTSTVAGNKKNLLIPKTAVLWTGKRAVVYVKVPEREQPSFKYREIILGPVAGDFYVVNRGLKEGEEIAVNGVFKIDAAAQLAGKPSMMNPEGGIISTGHNHADMNAGSEELSHNLVRKVPAREKQESETDNKFKIQLTDVYNTYLEMKNAFVASDAKQAGQKANLVNEKLKSVNMGLLTEESHMEWMKYLDQLENALQEINSSQDIAAQRKAFAEYNLVFYKVIKEFGLAAGTLYFQYCPMADGEKGAYWFSELKQIQNPYFGEAMLKCGETRETLNY